MDDWPGLARAQRRAMSCSLGCCRSSGISILKAARRIYQKAGKSCNWSKRTALRCSMFMLHVNPPFSMAPAVQEPP